MLGKRLKKNGPGAMVKKDRSADEGPNSLRQTESVCQRGGEGLPRGYNGGRGEAGDLRERGGGKNQEQREGDRRGDLYP